MYLYSNTYNIKNYTPLRIFDAQYATPSSTLREW
jgi:hypothetical protein